MNFGGEVHGCQTIDLRHNPQSPSQSLKGYPQVKKEPIVPTGTMINLFKTDKTATNLRLCLNWKPG